MSASFAVQKAIRARLVSTPGIVSLVPAASILDRNSRPAPVPSIILGEDTVADEGDIARRSQRVFSTLHLFMKESGLGGIKVLGGLIRASVHSTRLALPDGFQCGDSFISGERYMRDPDGETSHGVLTIETLVTGA